MPNLILMLLSSLLGLCRSQVAMQTEHRSASPPPASASVETTRAVQKRERLGGMLNYCYRAAAYGCAIAYPVAIAIPLPDDPFPALRSLTLSPLLNALNPHA
jgi:hypothetical protein